MDRNIRPEFRDILETLPKEKQIVGYTIASELSFLMTEMDKLKSTILENGSTDVFHQGKDNFERISPSFKSYLAAVTKFSALAGQLVRLLPKAERKKPQSSLDAFINSGDDLFRAVENHA